MTASRQLAGHTYRFEQGAAGAPVLLVLHGTGGNEDDLVPLARLVSPDATIVSPRGNVLENGMPRFFRRLAEGVFDVEDLHRRTDELGDFLRAAAAAHAFPQDRVVALGFSNGANVAASLMLSHPDLLRRGILIRAMVPFEPETPLDLGGTRALLSAGRADPIVPAANTERLADLMRSAGASVEMKWQLAGHSLVQGDVTDARAFLAEG
jgi:phospholipase/carboxylesterase